VLSIGVSKYKQAAYNLKGEILDSLLLLIKNMPLKEFLLLMQLQNG
jgi:hypothetical protein